MSDSGASTRNGRSLKHSKGHHTKRKHMTKIGVKKLNSTNSKKLRKPLNSHVGKRSFGKPIKYVKGIPWWVLLAGILLLVLIVVLIIALTS